MHATTELDDAGCLLDNSRLQTMAADAAVLESSYPVSRLWHNDPRRVLHFGLMTVTWLLK